jgi:hypothetical protein
MRISASRFASLSLVWTLALLVGLSPTTSEAQVLDPIQVTFTTSQSSYARGTPVQLTLDVKNSGLVPVTVSFSNGQKYEFTAQDASGATVWSWSYGKTFDSNPSSRTLAAGETWRIQETWSYTANAGGLATDGSYTVRGTFLGNYTGRSGTKAGQKAISLYTPDYLQVSFSADKSAYRRGEQAVLSLTMTNTAPYALEVNFATAQTHDFSATDIAGNPVWAWSAGQTFDGTPQVRTLAPGETWTVQEAWNFVDDSGAGLPDGDFVVSGIFLGDYLGRSGTKGGSQTVNLLTPDPLRVTFSTDKTSYVRTQASAQLSLVVTNIETYPVTIHFQNGKHSDFAVRNSSGQVVWTWSNGKTFPTQPSQVVLAPGQSLQYTQPWSYVNNSGLPVADGTYTASGTFFGLWYAESGTKSGQRQIRVSSF